MILPKQVALEKCFERALRKGFFILSILYNLYDASKWLLSF